MSNIPKELYLIIHANMCHKESTNNMLYVSGQHYLQ
jgi:hypothetical protein